MMKAMIWILAMVLIASGVSATYTLYDFEDFESYPISQGTLRNDSNVEWGCASFTSNHDSAYPFTGDDCLLGTSLLGGEWGWEEINTTIRNGESTKALRLIAMNGTDDGTRHFYRVGMSWNHTDTPNLNSFGNSDIWFKKSYWLMMNDPATTWYYNDASPYITQFQASYFSWGLVQSYKLFYFGIQRAEVNGMGGYPYQDDCSTDLECRHQYFQLKPEYYFQWFTNNRSGYSNTLTPNCFVDDGEWHFIEVYDYITGVDDKLRNHYIYVDGEECINYSLGGQTQSSGTDKMESLNIIAQGNQDFWIDDIRIYAGNTSPPVTGMKQCGDGIDNDGDGFTDYPADPSCTGYTDSTESPYDYVQCNNGLDDDGDGLIDYPDDPSCDNATDSSEFPADSTSQPETECVAEEYCLLDDEFPYNDDLSLHGWSGTLSFFETQYVYDGQRMVWDNLGSESFSFGKNISHENVYDEVTSSFAMYFDNLFESSNASYYYYITYLDADSRNIALFLFFLTQGTGDANIRVAVSYYNGSAYVPLVTYQPDDSDKLSRILFTVNFDQVLKTFDFIVSSTELSTEITDLPWTDIYASKVNQFYIHQGTFDSTKWEVVMDDVSIYGSVELAGFCDTWNLPYYLVETFNGFLSECGWYTSHNILASPDLEVTDDIAYYYMQKDSDLVEVENARYVTTKFDLNVVNITVIGSTITFRLYDSDGYNFQTLFFRDSGNYVFYNDDGTGKVASEINLSTNYQYMLITDLKEDSWAIYINDSRKVADSQFTDRFVNIHDIKTIKVTSNDAHFILDNLKIYGSDGEGSPLLPDEDLEEVIVTSEFQFCSLFWKDPDVCTEDDDCVTGKCLVTGSCSSFDWTYCDENQAVRGNGCVIGGMTKCALSSTGNLILDNFWLFLILLILIMGAVYLTIMFRRGN